MSDVGSGDESSADGGDYDDDTLSEDDTQIIHAALANDSIGASSSSSVELVASVTPVAGHISATVGDFFLVHGGYYPGPNGLENFRASRFLYVQHTRSGRWLRFLTSGTRPRVYSGAVGVLVGLDWFVFGGFVAIGSVNSSFAVYRLHLPSLSWSRVDAPSHCPPPINKHVGWEHDGRLFFFGGYGPIPRTRLANFSNGVYLAVGGEEEFFEPEENEYAGLGWNNLLLSFNIAEARFSNPKTCGATPSPRAAAAATKLRGRDVVVLFGGRNGARRLDDVYTLCLRSLTWTLVETLPGPDRPIGRSWCSLNETRNGELILYGGLSEGEVALGDAWRLVCRDGGWAWSRQSVPWGLAKPRVWHTAAVVGSTLFIHGGATCNLLQPPVDVPEMSAYASDVLRLELDGPRRLEEAALDAVASASVRADVARRLPKALGAQLRFRLAHRLLQRPTALACPNALARFCDGRFPDDENDDMQLEDPPSEDESSSFFSLLNSLS